VPDNKIMDAKGCVMSPMIVRQALAGITPSRCVVHPELVRSWDRAGFTVTAEFESPLDESIAEKMSVFPSSHMPRFQVTLAGIPLELSRFIFVNTVEFYDSDGNLLVSLENLGMGGEDRA
jgi:hypothetical protein